MNLKQILILLKLRWWLVLSLFTLIVAVAAVMSLLMPKQFTAQTQLMLDVKTDPLVATFMPNVGNPGYMATQAETLKSERIAGRVVKMLGLAENPTAVEQWRDDTAGRVTLESYFGEVLLRKLKVETVPQTTMLSVAYTANEPKFAAAVANAFAKAYLDFTIELRRGPATDSRAFLDSRLASVRSELQAAQDRLTAFQQKKGIVISAERVDLEQNRLNSLELEYAKALAQAATATSVQRGGGGDASPDVQASPVVQGLRQSLNAAETRLKEMSEVLGARHPQRMQLEAQVAELRAQYQREVGRVSNTTVSASRIAAQLVAELKTQVDQQKKTVLSLRGERDEASVLLRDVETANRAYDTVAQRRSQIDTESQSDQAAAKVLSPATEPLSHSAPNLPKNLLAAIVLGLAAGLAAAVAWELLDRRVRSEDDLAMGDVPIIGVLSSKPLDARSRMLPAPAQRLGQGGGNFPPQLTLDGGAT
jgi:chain length determinant protein EpsF